MDKSKFYLDLSKCIGEELKNIYTILGDTLKFESPSIVFNFPIMHYHEGMWLRTNFFQDKAKEDNFLEDKTELTYPEFIKLFEGGESKEVLQVENKEWIKAIAISHEKQMSSTHPHAIIGTIEDAIIEALENFKSKN